MCRRGRSPAFRGLCIGRRRKGHDGRCCKCKQNWKTQIHMNLNKKRLKCPSILISSGVAAVEADDAPESCASRSGSGARPDSSLWDSRTSFCTLAAAVAAVADTLEAAGAAGDTHAGVEAADGSPEAVAEAADDTPVEAGAAVCSSLPDRPALTWKPPSSRPRKGRSLVQGTFSWSILLMVGDTLRVVCSLADTITDFPYRSS